MNRVLLVGEAPSRSTDGGPAFSGRSGAFLEGLADLPPGELARTFALMNLLSRWPGAAGKASAFPAAIAREAADRLRELLSSEPAPDKIVLVGKRVARAFGEKNDVRLLAWQDRSFGPRSVQVAVFPHPSGVNRWWNDPFNRQRGRAFMLNLRGIR